MHYVDLAPVTHREVVPVVVARAIGLPDQPGRSSVDTVIRSIGDRRVLLVVDNCEHLLEPVASVVTELLGGCPALRLLATSRTARGARRGDFLVPSLSLADEAIDLFTDRARRVRPDFLLPRAIRQRLARSADASTECRWRSSSLRPGFGRCRWTTSSAACTTAFGCDRGARTAVRRQQTLRASVDWSHALLTEPERVLFRRLAVFLGGFDLDAAQSVAGATEIERYQVLDQLALLVDKSLVVAENTGSRHVIGCWRP